MTQQEIFDTVVRALGIQGKPSMQGSHCMYRAADGSKCAAGHLIPDEAYKTSMEHKVVSQISDAPGMPAFFKQQTAFIRELQKAHDERFYDPMAKTINTPAFISRLRHISDVYSLNPAVIDEAFPLATAA
jgi:hypothetical protein